MLDTLSMRTSESVADSATALHALLSAAESLLSAMGPGVFAALVSVPEGAGCVTPKRIFKSSRQLRMSIRTTLPKECIGDAANHFSHLRRLITVFMCRFP